MDLSKLVGLGPHKLVNQRLQRQAQSLEWYRPYFENYIVDASILKVGSAFMQVQKIIRSANLFVDHLVFSSL